MSRSESKRKADEVVGAGDDAGVKLVQNGGLLTRVVSEALAFGHVNVRLSLFWRPVVSRRVIITQTKSNGGSFNGNIDWLTWHTLDPDIEQRKLVVPITFMLHFPPPNADTWPNGFIIDAPAAVRVPNQILPEIIGDNHFASALKSDVIPLMDEDGTCALDWDGKERNQSSFLQPDSALTTHSVVDVTNKPWPRQDDWGFPDEIGVFIHKDYPYRFYYHDQGGGNFKYRMSILTGVFQVDPESVHDAILWMHILSVANEILIPELLGIVKSFLPNPFP